jgi:hypothetical protein
MSFYKSISVAVEARRFDGSGISGFNILEWLVNHGLKSATMFNNDMNGPSQIDLGIPHVKIAEIGDYVVRQVDGPSEGRRRFSVLSEEQFADTYEVSRHVYSKGI